MVYKCITFLDNSRALLYLGLEEDPAAPTSVTYTVTYDGSFEIEARIGSSNYYFTYDPLTEEMLFSGYRELTKL